MSFSWLAYALVSASLFFIVRFSVSLLGTARKHQLPYASEPANVLNVIKHRIQGIWKPVDFMQHGYQKFTKRDLPFILPNAHEGDVIMVPRRDIRALLTTPETKLSFKLHQSDHYEVKYTTVHDAYTGDVYERFLQNIRTDLTGNMGRYTGIMIDEIDMALDDYMGVSSTEWREINIHETMKKLACRVNHRIAIGLPLCREDKFLHAITLYTEYIVLGSNIIKFLPDWLKPILGPLITQPNRNLESVCYKYLVPVVEERIKSHQNCMRTGEPDCYDDFLQDMVRTAFEGNDQTERQPKSLAYRLVMLNFAAVHTTSISATNSLIDLISDAPSNQFWSNVVREARQVSAKAEAVWSKKEVDELRVLDACIRETNRLHGFDALGPHRRVVDPAGFTFPSGLHVKPGATLGLPLYCLHHDDEIYAEANAYHPDRFLGNATVLGQADREKDGNANFTATEASMVTTSDTYLAFSHGRRACPGRFVAAHTIKLIISRLALRYDVEPLDERPQMKWFGRFQIPDTSTKIRVRRNSTQQ